jgi:hypothetical protein
LSYLSKKQIIMPDNQKEEKKQQQQTEQKKPGEEKANRNEEDTQKLVERAISLAEFRQYVENNIPYNSYVFGVGKVKYYDASPDNLVVILPDKQVPIPYRRPPDEDESRRELDKLLFWGGAAFGGFSTGISFVAFDMHNPWYWTSATGARKSTKLLRTNPATGNRFQGNTGYKYGYLSAANRAKPVVNLVKGLSYVGLIIPVASTALKGEINVGDSTDFVFAAVAFIPTVGWVISGLYVVVDAVSVATTGEKISTHVARGAEKVNDYLFVKWVELNQGIKNWINSMSFGFYPIP